MTGLFDYLLTLIPYTTEHEIDRQSRHLREEINRKAQLLSRLEHVAQSFINRWREHRPDIVSAHHLEQQLAVLSEARQRAVNIVVMQDMENTLSSLEQQRVQIIHLTQDLQQNIETLTQHIKSLQQLKNEKIEALHLLQKLATTKNGTT